MAFAPGTYPEPPRNKQRERQHQEFEQAEREARKLKRQLSRNEIPIQELESFYKEHDLETEVLDKYNDSDLQSKDEKHFETKQWALELRVDLAAQMNVLQDRLREGRWDEHK